MDYHDSFITSYIAKINEGEGKAYTSRTLFFLTKAGVLLPIVIELLLPPKLTSAGECWTSRVFTSPPPGKINWLWQLAKGHVALVDTVYQHLCSHWYVLTLKPSNHNYPFFTLVPTDMHTHSFIPFFIFLCTIIELHSQSPPLSHTSRHSKHGQLRSHLFLQQSTKFIII